MSEDIDKSMMTVSHQMRISIEIEILIKSQNSRDEKDNY